MSISIHELEDIEDLRRLADLFAVVWGRPGEPPINSDILKALAHSGNYVSGAYVDNTLVGGLVGWFGGVPPHELRMPSPILGQLGGIHARLVRLALQQPHRRWF